MSLGACVGPVQEMGMNFKHRGTVDCRQNIGMPSFEILVNPKLVWNSWNLACYHGAASTWRGTNFVPLGAGLGIYASHKSELLTTSMMVFARESPTFGDKTISIASYCFQKIFSCQHRTTRVLCEFLWFSGFVWTFLCINWVFNAFYVHNSNSNYMHMLKCI